VYIDRCRLEGGHRLLTCNEKLIPGVLRERDCRDSPWRSRHSFRSQGSLINCLGPIEVKVG
jgi:hypothetical protein